MTPRAKITAAVTATLLTLTACSSSDTREPDQPRPSKQEQAQNPPPTKRQTKGTTIVALTFDDGYGSQLTAANLLNKHSMRGTFYIIDSALGGGRYMTWPQVRQLADAGNEIGGHTVTHPHLEGMSLQDQRAEICNNRATLTERGFTVTDFAYPYGEADPPLPSVARRCGYTTARDVSGLVNQGDCTDCPKANQLPLEEPHRIRGNSSTTRPALLREYVTQAGTVKGKVLVPLIFHHICDPCTGDPTDEQISPTDLDLFLTWLDNQPSTKTQTIAQATGGKG
jgi:hypothetical protein